MDKYYLATKGQCKIEKVEEKVADKNIQIPITVRRKKWRYQLKVRFVIIHG
ncbi:hypothetical protein [Clostridium sporogenes]|uniref:hypothetical protein n=1 Tax=Clostridium sporogenes TaxID=1509 RepID=UPI000179465A|nr:hypothetical protein [Clostridium sporogenes]EKS4342409.1 hypothetical protein [Clostridium botulinum]EDU37173.1 hypothetical protein CLOSPO_03342 [Clostridium sporogenes ATCC 15579]EKS4393876.1 hypothetical protein [Clostridium botulinum]MCR1975909.1 hypothetical protein [Clostridium sporogenes]MCW6080502.1 hypothetical protein [Clostridium sporogenes]